MKEVALSDAPAPLGELVAEIERTGETVVLTREGKPAATLEPARSAPLGQPVAEVLARIVARRDDLAREHPETARPIPWEELKAEMDEDR